MRSMLLLLPMIATLTATPLVAAQKINGPAVACLTEERLSEVHGAIARDDLRQAEAIIATDQCFILDGQEFSVVDRGFFTSEIRVYIGGTSGLVFISTESISESN